MLREKQGKPEEPAVSYNPEHLFEVHPVTRINRLRLLDSLKRVEGFKPGAATRTFGIYESTGCALSVTPATVTIRTKTGLYNDVEFTMELAEEDQQVVRDGRFVIASVVDPDGSGYLVKRLRMVFVKGSAPERAVKLLKRGDRLHVWGIPRINLAEISRKARESGTTPAAITFPLPYEIVVIGADSNRT